jgi:hypothetical protein
VKKKKLTSFFDNGSQCNIVSEALFDELGLETYNLVQSSSLVWLQGKTVMIINWRCKIIFSISFDYVDEVECEFAPMHACGVMLGSPYLWDMDATFYMKERNYHLVKGGKAYLIKGHQERERE